MIWVGRILKILLLLFLLFDAIMKIIKISYVLKATSQLGLPEPSIQPIGFYLLAATILMAVPRTTLLGGLLLTAYLGAAAGITFVAKLGGHPYLFPIAFCILLWVAELLQNQKLKTHVIPSIPG